MSSSDENNDSGDLTRIEDLSEFIHEEDETEFDSLEDQDDELISEQNTDPAIELNSFDSFNSDEEDFSEEEIEEVKVESEEESDTDFDFSAAEDDQFDFPKNDFSENDFEAEEIQGEDSEDQDSTSLFTPLSDLAPEEEINDTPIEKTEIQRPTIEELPGGSKKENPIDEVKVFANNLSLSNYTSVGNPPFSIIIKNVKFYEDIDQIIDILFTIKLIEKNQEEETRQSLERGQMLISRLGEYSAIDLCHRLRKFDLELEMGLTEEINPPKSYQSSDFGVTTKATIYGNKKDFLKIRKEISHEEIITSTLTHIDKYQIVQYLGVLTETSLIKQSDLIASPHLEDQIDENLNSLNPEYRVKSITNSNKKASQSSTEDLVRIHQDEAEEKRNTSLDFIYSELTAKLKNKALQNKANGVIGINFSIIPLPSNSPSHIEMSYQVLCTGNSVWLEKI